jgi:hypothetical protein
VAFDAVFWANVIIAEDKHSGGVFWGDWIRLWILVGASQPEGGVNVHSRTLKDGKPGLKL